jgi:hypothetical protein
VPQAPTTPGGPTPVIDYCDNLPGVQWEGYDCSTGATKTDSAEVVVPVVVPPLAGTVVPPKKPAKKPAKKPTKVTSAQPGSVDAGVASLPSSANIPSAVDAGGGSSAPSTPLLGWALLAAGLLGALGATGSLVAGRKE